MGRPLFDAHLHVVDPAYALVPNQGFVPEPFSVTDYRTAVRGLGVRGGAVVSGSFQAFDQRYLLAALELLGPGFVGVTQLPPDVADDELRRLDAAGVRAVRFNLRRGGSAGAGDLLDLGRRVADVVGWHVELYVDSRDLPDLAPAIRQLPQVVVDHLGLSAAGLDGLVRLVAEQGVKVKATGFGRVDLDVAAALRRIADADPSALLVGTDLPSTRAPRPFRPADLDLVDEALGEQLASRARWDNAWALYRPADRRRGESRGGESNP